jgi:hypothetical protein
VPLEADALLPYPEPAIADINVNRRLSNLWKHGYRFVILSGPPGSGKTRAAEDWIAHLHFLSRSKFQHGDVRLSGVFPDFRQRVYSNEEIRAIITYRNLTFAWDMIVLHPQYSYEDLIRGLQISNSSSDSSPTLVVREGILGFAARVAEQIELIVGTSDQPTVTLILDEINRAPIGQLFGEALFALDRRGVGVVTPYPLEGLDSRLTIPSSLQIIGTMNSIDRATSGFDLALRRRFANLPMRSSRDVVKQYWENCGASSPYGLRLYDRLNRLITTSTLTGEISKLDLVLGHSYFLPPIWVSIESDFIDWLLTSFVFQMIPTLADFEDQGLVEYSTDEVQLLPGGCGLDHAKLIQVLSSDLQAKFKESLSAETSL